MLRNNIPLRKLIKKVNIDLRNHITPHVLI